MSGEERVSRSGGGNGNVRDGCEMSGEVRPGSDSPCVCDLSRRGATAHFAPIREPWCVVAMGSDAPFQQQDTGQRVLHLPTHGV